jgi:hypothetical protein
MQTTRMREGQMASARVARASSVCSHAYPWSVVVDADIAEIGGFADTKHLTTRRPKEASP